MVIFHAIVRMGKSGNMIEQKGITGFASSVNHSKSTGTSCFLEIDIDGTNP